MRTLALIIATLTLGCGAAPVAPHAVVTLHLAGAAADAEPLARLTASEASQNPTWTQDGGAMRLP